MKGVGQERMVECLESGQDPKWAVEPLLVVAMQEIKFNTHAKVVVKLWILLFKSTCTDF
jgi:hypothetical protein